MSSTKKTNYRYCYLCGAVPAVEDNISLFKFPKESDRLNIWLKFCDLQKDEMCPGYALCNRHFKSVIGSSSQKQKRLPNDAVPTLMTESAYERHVTFEKSSEESCTVESHLVIDSLISNFTVPNLNKQSSNYEEINSHEESGSNSNISDGNLCTPPSSKCAKRPLRYIGDIRSGDLYTSKRRQECVKLIHFQNLKQQKEIKHLKEALKRKKNQIETLKDTLHSLKEEKLLSDNAAAII